MFSALHCNLLRFSILVLRIYIYIIHREYVHMYLKHYIIFTSGNWIFHWFMSLVTWYSKKWKKTHFFLTKGQLFVHLFQEFGRPAKTSSKTPHIAASRLIIETPRNQIFQQMTIHLSSLRTGLQTFRWRDGMDKKCVQVPGNRKCSNFPGFTNTKGSIFATILRGSFLKVP